METDDLIKALASCGTGLLLHENGGLVLAKKLGAGQYKYCVTGAPAGGAGLLTLYEWLHQPLPALKKSETHSSSHTSTCARHPQTFTRLVPWPDFTSGVQEMLQYLKVQMPERCLHRLVWNVLKPASAATVSAVSEVDIRGLVLVGFLNHINSVAEHLGLCTEYQGNGSNRATSFTDLVLRHASTTDVNHLSALILAVVEVKGPWQLDLPADTDLVQALDDNGLRPKFLPALQQAYGDAVVDEAPLIILTTYATTYFIKRSHNVEDKTLTVSPPVPSCGSKELPALAAWFYVMQLAQTMWPKQQAWPLPAQLTPGNAPVADGSGPVSSSGADTRREAGSTSTVAGMWDGAAWLRLAHSSSAEEAVAALPELSLQQVGYTDECLSSTSHTRVLKGTYDARAAALKLYDPHSAPAVSRFIQEATAYLQLHQLQGVCVPHLLAIGRLAFTGAPVLVLQRAEPCSDMCGDAAWEALSQLHAAGAAHGDVRRSNLLKCGQRVLLSDLETCITTAGPQHWDADVEQMEACFPGLHSD